MSKFVVGLGTFVVFSVFAASSAMAGPTALSCPVTQGNLTKALQKAAGDDSSGLNNDYWAVVVNREGVVCAVSYSGADQ